MKKEVIIIIVLLVSGFIFANLVKAQDIEQLQNMENPADVIKNKTGGIISEEGINTSEDAWKPFKSKAEERIEAINTWLDKNAFWMKYIFGMRPEISWIFIINLFLMILAIYTLIFTMPEFTAFSKTIARIIGATIIVILVEIQIIANLAKKIDEWVDKWWTKLIAIFGLLLIIAGSGAMYKLAKKMEEDRKKEQEDLDRTQLHGEAEAFGTAAEGFRKIK